MKQVNFLRRCLKLLKINYVYTSGISTVHLDIIKDGFILEFHFDKVTLKFIELGIFKVSDLVKEDLTC